MKHSSVAILAGVLTVFIPSSAAVATIPTVPPSPDAVAYAASKGVSVTEAERRIRLQDRFNSMTEAVASDPMFVESEVVSTKEDFRIHLRATRGGIARMLRSAIARDPELAPILQIDTSPRSIQLLGIMRDSLMRQFTQMREATAIRVDGLRGEIIGEVSSPEAVQPRLRYTGFGRYIKLEKRSTFPVPIVNLRGGVLVSSSKGNCTTAFGVRSGTLTGILSGGHCVQSSPGGPVVSSTVNTQGAALQVQRSIWDATRDFMWAAGSGHAGTNLVFDGNRDRPITQVFTGNVSRGTIVCKYGITTSYTCQEVINPSYTGTDAAGNTVGPLVETGGTSANIANCGDSGGPVFSGGIAYGVVARGDVNGSCTGGNRMIYAPAKNISSLGVTILTS